MPDSYVALEHALQSKVAVPTYIFGCYYAARAEDQNAADALLMTCLGPRQRRERWMPLLSEPAAPGGAAVSWGDLDPADL